MITPRNTAIVIALVLIVGAGYYFQNVPSEEGTVATSTPIVATTTQETSSVPDLGIVIDQNMPTTKPAPSLTRAITVPDIFSDEEKKSIREEMQKRIDLLKNNKTNYEVWMELAVYRKLINDYKGAAEIWEYTKELRPFSYVSFHNLGDLYAYFDRDLAKAELNFKKTVELGKDRAELYRAYADFHLTVYKNKARAIEILNQGISAGADDKGELARYRDLL